MSLDEKKKYWLALMHKRMRKQGEAFDEIFDDVTKNLGFKFDGEEYRKRIKS